MNRPIFTSLFIFVLAVALYLPVLDADFVWDARSQVLTDTFIHQPGHLLDVLTLRVLALDVLDANRPVHLASMMLDAVVWGKNPFGYHLTSILLHGAVTVLIFVFARRLTAPIPAFVGALLFAVHPLNCEAVAEVSYREDLLAAFFTLGALNCAAMWREREIWPAIGAVLCCALAVGSKECGIAAPFALAAFVFWFRRESGKVGALLVGAALLATGALLAARFMLAVEHSLIFTDKPQPIAGSFVDIALVQTRIWAAYIWRIFWPIGFCADYGPVNIRAYSLGGSLVAVLAFANAGIVMACKNRVAALGMILFWGSLLTVSNFIPIYRAMADRFLYVPMTGLALCIAGACTLVRRQNLVLLAGLLFALPLMIVTWKREPVWHDSLALWKDTLAKNPESFSAATNLADALIGIGCNEQAIRAADRSVVLSQQKQAMPFALRATALENLGRREEATRELERAVALDKRYRDPQKLVAALVWEPRNLPALERIAARLPPHE